MTYKTTDPVILERRKKVLILRAKGLTQEEIEKALGVDQVTVSRDLKVLKDEAKKSLDELARDMFVLQYQQCITGIEQVYREAWLMYHDQNSSDKTKLAALSLIKETYESMFRMLGEGPTVLSVKRLGEKVEKISQGN